MKRLGSSKDKKDTQKIAGERKVIGVKSDERQNEAV